MDAWNLCDILRFLDARGGTIIARGGKTLLSLPDTFERPKIEREILPHLKARKLEIIEYFTEPPPPVPHPFQIARPSLFASDDHTKHVEPVDPFAPKTAEDAALEADFQRLEAARVVTSGERSRKQIIKSLCLQAVASGCPVLLLLRTKGRAVEYRPYKQRRASRGTRKDPFKPKPIPVERQATHACIPGHTDWIKLPKVTTAEEDMRLEPLKRRKHGKGD